MSGTFVPQAALAGVLRQVPHIWQIKLGWSDEIFPENKQGRIFNEQKRYKNHVVMFLFY